METKYKTHLICGVILLLLGPFFPPGADLWANEDSKYLDAVREFADNVLKYGRDTYGPKHTPLFVDGLNIHSHEPVKWRYVGQVWILSNLASQQNLFRTLDGLTKITGNPKYRQAAMEAIEYAFANLQSPNGLLYWGGHLAYDALSDKPTITNKFYHELKYHHPYYELMWQVNPDATRRFIEAFWSAHILEWSNLDMDRHGSMDKRLARPWKYEYEGGPVFFETKLPWSQSFLNTGTDLVYAASLLTNLSGDKEPLVWAKRLAYRYVETRNSKTGIGGIQYTRLKRDRAQLQFGDDFQGHLVLAGTLFRGTWNSVQSQISYFLLADILGEDGDTFKRWATEELKAWGKVTYRKQDNSWIPMLTDGTILEGYIYTKNGYFGSKGTVCKASRASFIDFWAYTIAYRITTDRFMWEMARNIAEGSNLGKFGASPTDDHQLTNDTHCSDPYALLGFLELYRKSGKEAFLEIASRIGDNILSHRFHEGFFVPRKDCIFAKFDYLEPLVLLHLDKVVGAKCSFVPTIWPSRSFFACNYDGHEREEDTFVLYSQTKSAELIRLLHEAAWDNKIDEVNLLISKGADVKAGDWADIVACQRILGMSDIPDPELKLSLTWDTTALHYAAEKGHKEIAELLIAKGADVNVRNNNGQTPLDFALSRGYMGIVRLLADNGADISIHIAARCGALVKVKSLIESGTNPNTKDSSGNTPLHCAAEEGQKDVAEFLITEDADLNVETKEGRTPLRIAADRGHTDIAELLITNGATIKRRQGLLERLTSRGDNSSAFHIAACAGDIARLKHFVGKDSDVNVKDRFGWTPLFWAASTGRKKAVEFLISSGADINAKANDRTTVLHKVVRRGSNNMAELLITKGANVNIKYWGGWTALHEAASNGNKDIVVLLIARGADVNAKNQMSITPLRMAVEKGHAEIVELLITRGADINVKDQWDTTPLRLASDRGHPEIVELLRKHGAKEDGEEEKAPESAPAPKEEKPDDPNTVEIKEPDSAGFFGRVGGPLRSSVLSALF